jgi:S1-C subfamily serine protease
MSEGIDVSGVSMSVADRKAILVMIVVSIVLGGAFAIVYLDLKADITALKDSNANLSAQFEQLQALIEALHANQTTGLSAVQIYNRTKQSVVLIVCDRGGGQGAEGTGFVYDTQGHIVTNNHVIDQAINITVTFFDGNVSSATLVGHDVYSDLAVIQASTMPIQAYPLVVANSSDLLVGEPVYAIGNPFGLSSSMTSGIVSQLGRVLYLADLGVPLPWGQYSIVDVIQFDAAINPGNSGGPLLDSFGRLVGVTFAIETGSSSNTGFIGIGYGVPSALLMRVVPALIQPGHYHHPWVGISYDSSYIGGVLILAVNASSPAEASGLHVNDIIKGVDKQTINRGEEFMIYLERNKSPGDTITLNVTRGGAVQPPINLTLGERQGPQ